LDQVSTCLLSPFELTGRARSHVAQFEGPRFAVQPRVAEAFCDMRSAAAKAGLDLLPFSSFRDFGTQVRIWNSKFRGTRTLYDADGAPRSHGAMGKEQLLWAILEWSALPGASRHHWGTEIDVVDRAAMPAGYRVRLLPEEIAEDGVFHRLHQWLTEHMAGFGFHRPYDVERGGMHAEPWHLSFGELSRPALQALTPEVVLEALETDGTVLEVGLIREQLEEIFSRHVLNVAGLEGA